MSGLHRYHDELVYVVAKLPREGVRGMTCFLTDEPGRWSLSVWNAKHYHRLRRAEAESEAGRHEGAECFAVDVVLTRKAKQSEDVALMGEAFCEVADEWMTGTLVDDDAVVTDFDRAQSGRELDAFDEIFKRLAKLPFSSRCRVMSLLVRRVGVSFGVPPNPAWPVERIPRTRTYEEW